MLTEKQMPERVEVRPAFSTPVIMAMVPEAERINKALRKTILAHEKKMPQRTTYDSNIGGWHSDRDLLDWGGAPVQQVVDTAKELADRMTAARSGRPAEVVWLSNAWANINRKGHSNEPHVHPGCFWSGVYYVDDGGCAKNREHGGEFVISDPRGAAPSMYAPNLCFRGPGGSSVGATELVPPREGVLMMFPAWLLHGVRPYLGPGTRISISFNLSVKPD